MGPGYTEMFFLDEVTALAAGHRPCFECRRADANAFGEAWRECEGLDTRPRAVEIDRVLHAERLNGKAKRSHPMPWGSVVDGSIVLLEGALIAKRKGEPLVWSHKGYKTHAAIDGNVEVACQTPPQIQRVLDAGYAPQWHPSAAQWT